MRLYLTQPMEDFRSQFRVSFDPPIYDSDGDYWGDEGLLICKESAAKLVGGEENLPVFGEHVELKVEVDW